MTYVRNFIPRGHIKHTSACVSMACLGSQHTRTDIYSHHIILPFFSKNYSSDMPDTLSLLNKVAIVTGSGRENGIGAGIGLALARNGASVVVHYVSDSVKDRAAEVCETLRKSGGQAIAVQAALDTIDGAKRLVNETLEGFNTDHIDILGKILLYTYHWD